MPGGCGLVRSVLVLFVVIAFAPDRARAVCFRDVMKHVGRPQSLFGAKHGLHVIHVKWVDLTTPIRVTGIDPHNRLKSVDMSNNPDRLKLLRDLLTTDLGTAFIQDPLLALESKGL